MSRENPLKGKKASKVTAAFKALMCLAALLAVGALATGCSGKGTAEESSSEIMTAAENEKPTINAAETKAETTAAPETESANEAETETVPDEEPPEPGLVRSPITNEWVSGEQASRRPVAVMYPIDKKAQPQYGLNKVSVFYEILEEGSMSRQMGLLENWEELSRIGNVRSIRDYFIYEALEWDAIIVHFGGPEVFVKPMLTREDVNNINGVGGVMGSDYGAFYRIPAGSRSEHTAYTDGEHLLKAIEKAEYKRDYREGLYQPDRWHFASASSPIDLSQRSDSLPAAKLDMAGCYPITKSSFSYNSEDGLYYRSIYGAPQKDGATGEQLAFRNILIESCTSGERGAGYLYFNVLDGGHQGYFITGGNMIHVTWVKTNEYEPTRFYDDNGEEITLNTGKTMVCIVRDGSDSFTADGAKYSF